MARSNGLVFALDPDRTSSLCDQLAARDGRALAVGGCTLELIVDQGRVLGAVISWEWAVPLKVERLALAIVNAGGVLRRDLDAEATLQAARDEGRRVVAIDSARELAPFRRKALALAPYAPAIPRRHLASVA